MCENYIKIEFFVSKFFQRICYELIISIHIVIVLFLYKIHVIAVFFNIAASDLLCCQLYCSQKFSDFYCLHLSILVFSFDKLIFFSTLARGSPFINTVTPQNVTRKTVPCWPLYKLCRVSGGLSVG